MRKDHDLTMAPNQQDPTPPTSHQMLPMVSQTTPSGLNTGIPQVVTREPDKLVATARDFARAAGAKR